MPIKRKGGLVVALLGLSVTSIISPASADDSAASVCATTTAAYLEATKSGDAAKVTALFSPDGEWTAPEGNIAGREALTKAMSAFIKPGVDQTDKQLSARLIGGLVMCSGEYVFTFAPGSPMKQVSGLYTKTLAKSGDQWQFVQLTTNYTPPPMPPAAQAQAH